MNARNILRICTALTVFNLALDGALHAAAHSKWAYPGPDGKLVYQPVDRWGNRIPNFSKAGYMGGGVAIPLLPVKATISPDNDDKDDTPRIQAAIDRVSVKPPDENGHRGAVLLKAGKYRIEGTVRISAWGVVLRGQGNGPDGTVLLAPEFPKNWRDMENFNPDRPIVSVSGRDRTEAHEKKGRGKKNITSVRITDKYVPIGATSVRVESTEGLSVGDYIKLQGPKNARRNMANRPCPIWNAQPDGAPTPSGASTSPAPAADARALALPEFGATPSTSTPTSGRRCPKRSTTSQAAAPERLQNICRSRTIEYPSAAWRTW